MKRQRALLPVFLFLIASACASKAKEDPAAKFTPVTEPDPTAPPGAPGPVNEDLLSSRQRPRHRAVR